MSGCYGEMVKSAGGENRVRLPETSQVPEARTTNSIPGGTEFDFCVWFEKNKEEAQDISGKQHQTDLERLCRGCGRGGRGRYLSDVGKPGLGAVGEIGGSQVA